MPDRSFVRMEKTVMQSCWIRRLNPTCPFEEEELEPSPVCTHFTKDFSSCSKRLLKARHHTRSSSWPPNERTTNCSPSLDLKLVEPVDIKEQFLLSRATLPKFREENSRVPLQDGSESNNFCFKTGSLFSSQNSSHKSVSTLEALVPHSRAASTCDDFHAGESNNEGTLKNSVAQRLYSKFNKESGSLLKVGSSTVLGDAPCKGKLSVSELPHTIAHPRGSSPDAVIGTSLSPALMGASADADDRTCISRPLIRSVYQSTPSKLSINRPAAMFAEDKINKDQSGMVFNKYPGKFCGKEIKTRRNFSFLHFAGQSKKLNQLAGGCSDKVGACDRGSGLSTASKSIQRKNNVGFGTFATNAGPFVSKEFYNLQSFNKDLRRCDPVVPDHPCSPKEKFDTKMPRTRVSSGDFTRASCRETTLDEYWVQLFEDSGPVKLFDTIPPQEHITDGCYRFSFNSTAYSWKPDENEKLKSFPHPGAHIPLNNNAQIYASCDVLPQTQVSLRSSFIQTKQTGSGHNASASARSRPLEGTSVLKTWQEDSLKGEMRRLASKTGKKELFCDDGRITEPSTLNEAWIQRWRSSSNLTSFGMDKEQGLAAEKCHAITSSKGVKNMDCVDLNLLEPARTSKLQMGGSDRGYDSGLQMGGSGRGYDSGLGATSRGSFPVYKSYCRSKYMAPSVEAMAIVGNMAGKLHTTALENSGSFSVWPCPSKKNFQEKRLPALRETVEDNMHGVDMDDLEFLERKMR